MTPDLMPVLTSDTALEQSPPPVKTVRVLPKELQKYIFQKGHIGMGGRPKGSRNRLSAQDILKRREPRIAKRYVERAEKSDTVLIDAMKHLLPKDHGVAGDRPQLVIFIGDGNLPRTLIDPSSITIPEHLPRS